MSIKRTSSHTFSNVSVEPHEAQARVLQEILFTRVKLPGEDKIARVGPTIHEGLRIHDPDEKEKTQSQSGLIALIAKTLNVVRENVSMWIYGAHHMPEKYLAPLAQLLQLDETEKRDLYRAVIVPQYTGTIDDIFDQLKPHGSKLSPRRVINAVRERCCVDPQNNVLAWEKMLERVPVDQWPHYRQLTDKMLRERAPGWNTAKTLNALTPVGVGHKRTFLEMFVVPQQREPHFGPGTDNRGSGDILQNLILTHAFDRQGKIRSWQSLYDESERNGDPDLLSDAQPVNHSNLAAKLKENMGSKAAHLAHSHVHEWLKRGNKPKEPVRTALFDLFDLTIQQREIYNAAVRFPARDYRSRA